jgi:hypothetical protein
MRVRAFHGRGLETDMLVRRRGVGRQLVWTFNRPSEQLAERDIQGVNGTTKGVKKML